MPRPGKSKLMLIIVSFFIAACFLFLCYLIFANYLTERDRQANLALWESQKQVSPEESAAESSIVSAEKYNTEVNTASNTTPVKKSGTDYSELVSEDFFPLKLTIPKIDLEWVSYEGTDTLTLEQGPGHITETPLPGDTGRCTISGHRTTYGSPFSRVDELEDGDFIYLETIDGKLFTYTVTGRDIVNPEDVYVLEGSYKKELLLTTCHPRYSSAKRFIIIAELINIYPLEIGSYGRIR